MSEEIKMSDSEKYIRASAVMDFVDMIRGAYDSGFIGNHPTNYDIYRSAQVHVKDRYGVESGNWDDELAKESRSNNHDRLTDENKRLREALLLVLDAACQPYSCSEDTCDMVNQLLSELEGEK